MPERLKPRKTNCHKFAFSKFQKFKPIFYLIIQYLKIVPECLKLRNSNCNQFTLRRFKNSNRYFNHIVTKHLEFTWKFEPELPNSNLHFDVWKIQTSILPSVLPKIVFNHQKLVLPAQFQCHYPWHFQIVLWISTSDPYDQFAKIKIVIPLAKIISPLYHFTTI